ncbi:sigma-70 family RNA polymerase sigma factor [Gellertiella hungarica]|uniref:RNA polymerase sigma-70 factor (ECF subfamily) n=1 Tax=Gellertiella hungarica TaxID=1572859 RepID=A0A7W6J347_9HYPH|nr:sigma-70 family RNA polymerase sigma factor [Gellertiella hungarica]MBB4063837.1 RNA polymerase sigma-70 factor (ECF subfamily) [Gellertiella hungarica]
MAVDDLSELISRVALRDRAAFSLLYQRSSPKLFAVCLRILKDRTEAEEALQEVFIKVWQRADRFASEGRNASGWLTAIARNHSIDLIRTRKPIADQIEEEYDLADPSPDPEREAELSAEGRRIDRCMNELDPDRATAVRRAYVEGLSYQELADQFRVPLNTMRTWLRRSLIKLRECLDR